MRRVSPQPRRSQHGLSIVELMVGVAVGLIVTASATVLVASQLADNRRLLLETQVQQDLRAAADLIVRDVRRAGYWGGASRASANGAGLAGMAVNPYSAISLPNDGDVGSELTYAYADRNAVEDDAITGEEMRGVRLNGGALQLQLGDGNWQALTDASTLTITRFDVTSDVQPVVLACHRACATPGSPCPPRIEVRSVTIQIEGQAVSDATIRRSVRAHARLRNDLIVGECRD